MKVITPERLVNTLRKTYETARHPETPKRLNRIQALGAIVMGLVVGWVQWSQGHADKAHKRTERRKPLPERDIQTEAAMFTGSRKAPIPLEARKKFSWSPGVIFGLLKETVAQWSLDKAPTLAAALSYYTIFSIAPLLIIAIAIAGLVFGQEAAQNQIVAQLQGMLGKEGAEFIQSMIQNASKPDSGIVATVIGVVTLLAGAAGVVAQLKGAMNTIWNVTPPPGPGGIKGILLAIRQQFLSYAMVLGVGFLLLVSLLLSALLAGLSTRLDGPTFVYEILHIVISLAVITLLFAAIYKVLPDVDIKWHDVWVGAFVTAVLFTIGKILIGLYLGHSGTASAYGAAGSLVVILLWIYYSAQILFLGAELTQVYANQYGSNLVARGQRKAEKVARAQSGQQVASTQAGR